jgi:hypothetical protein
MFTSAFSREHYFGASMRGRSLALLMTAATGQFASREDANIVLEDAGLEQGANFVLKDDAGLQQQPYKACLAAWGKGFVPVMTHLHDQELLNFYNTHRGSRSGKGKRVALLLRGELNRAGQKDEFGVRDTKGGTVQQEIVSASHLKNIIHPLEQIGYEVDVFASYFSHEESFALKVLPLYGSRLLGKAVGNSSQSYIKKMNPLFHKLTLGISEWDQGYLIGLAADLLKRHILQDSVVYDFALIWRWDLMPMRPLTKKSVWRMTQHVFLANEDVGYSVPGPLISSMVKVFGHSRCWFAGFGGLCNAMHEHSALNMYETHWMHMFKFWQRADQAHEKQEFCFTQLDFSKMFAPNDFDNVDEQVVCCPKARIFFIIPRCDDHNGWIEKAWITNKTFLASLASAVEPAFKLGKWKADLEAWYQRCPADEENQQPPKTFFAGW